ncbi:hypothetical protein SDJN02_25533, partial [Cucurbita argyrosperma subsp. argyrosperma]
MNVRSHNPPPFRVQSPRWHTAQCLLPSEFNVLVRTPLSQLQLLACDFLIYADLFVEIMGILHRSSVIKRPNDSMRVILTTFVGVFLGFLIGISFPLLSLTKLGVPPGLVLKVDQMYNTDMKSGGSSQTPENVAFDRSGSGGLNGSSEIWVPSNPRGAERLAPGIVAAESDFYLHRLWGNPNEDLPRKPNYLVTFTVGYNQRDNIDKAVKKGKLIRESPKRTISASGRLGPLQMVSEPDTGLCASEKAVPRRRVDLVGFHIDWRKEQVSARTLGPERGVDCENPTLVGEENNILYKTECNSSQFSENFTILLFHYDGRTTEWDDFEWSKRAIHVSARKQSKWWYAKRFLHPDIVAPYDYIFVWDEDLGVENFDAEEYIKLVRKHGLEISQPGLEPVKGLAWQMTKKQDGLETYGGKGGMVHRAEHASLCRPKPNASRYCPLWAFPFELLLKVFKMRPFCRDHGSGILTSGLALRLNDLIHGWGLDFAVRKCVEPAHEKIGVVDAQWIVHQGLPSLGSQGETEVGKAPWQGVRERCKKEWTMFQSRLANAEKAYFKSLENHRSNISVRDPNPYLDFLLSDTHRKRKGCDNLMSDFFPFVEHLELPNLSFALERESQDRLVLMALEAILNEKLHFVYLPCSFAYRKNKNIRDFDAKVVGWDGVRAVTGDCEAL